MGIDWCTKVGDLGENKKPSEAESQHDQTGVNSQAQLHRQLRKDDASDNEHKI